MRYPKNCPERISGISESTKGRALKFSESLGMVLKKPLVGKSFRYTFKIFLDMA